MQSNKPLVSVLIGTYNRAGLLPRAVNSVLGQDYDNFEIVVVDDASTDSTPEVMRTFRDSRVKYVRHKENTGIAVVSNTAFKHCKGEFIMLLGDDDEWTDKNKISKQVEVFRRSEEPNLGIVTTWWQDVKDGRILRQHKPEMPSDLIETMLIGNIICGSVVMFSRQAWEAVGGFDENMKRGTDSELARSIITHGYKAEIIPEVMADIHVAGADRMSHRNTPDRVKTAMSMVQYLLLKYSTLYEKHMRAKAFRLYQLADLSLIMYALEGHNGDLVACSRYIRKALKYKVLWRPIFKYSIVRFFGCKPLRLYWRLYG